MKKTLAGGLVVASAAAPVFAEGSGGISLTAATTAATDVQTALTTFFTSTLGPVVSAVGGAALAVYLILVVFKWARKLGK